MPEIEIRPVSLDDVDAMVEAARESVREVQPWLPWCHPGYSHEEARTWISAQKRAFAAGEEFQFTIRAARGRHLGGIGLNYLNHEHRVANLGYWVRTGAAGAGVATGAVGLAWRWAFDNTVLQRLEIVVAAGNRASERVAERAGAVREATLRARLYLHGEAHDATLFSIVRPGPGRSANGGHGR